MGSAQGHGLHVCEDEAILECVDDVGAQADSEVPAARTLITSLSNRTFPFIRYDIGDRVRLLPGECPCGSSFVRIAAIEGRLDDEFRYSTTVVPPLVFRHVLGADPAVSEYQVTQTPTGAGILVVGNPDTASLTSALVAAPSQRGVVFHQRSGFRSSASCRGIRPAASSGDSFRCRGQVLLGCGWRGFSAGNGSRGPYTAPASRGTVDGVPHPIMFRDDDPGLAELRRIALGFPETFEKISHGRPSFCVPKMFAVYGGNVKVRPGQMTPHPHCVLVKVDDGERKALEQDPRFFHPAYLGPFGWLGLDLDSVADWAEVGELVDASYRLVAPPRLIRQLDAE